MWPYSWTHVGTPSHMGHMDRVAATMPSQAHAGAAQEAPNIGQWEGQDVPLVRPSSCIVKGGIPSSRRYLPTYLNLCVYTCFIYLQPFCVTLNFKLFIDSIHILFLLHSLLWFWDVTIKNLQVFIEIHRARIKDIFPVAEANPENLSNRL